MALWDFVAAVVLGGRTRYIDWTKIALSPKRVMRFVHHYGGSIARKAFANLLECGGTFEATPFLA